MCQNSNNISEQYLVVMPEPDESSINTNDLVEAHCDAGTELCLGLDDGIITESNGNEEDSYIQEKPSEAAFDCDLVDIEKYLDEAITNPLETLQFTSNALCTICSHRPLTYEHILSHIAPLLVNEVNEIACELGYCFRAFRDEKILARHIILSHTDLNSFQIYVNCPICNIKYSNFANFNKHSCCRTLKRENRQDHICATCKAQFPSFKRLNFHAQEHMLNRRPKVCLICEMSFSNMERFFEHVQYAHEPADSYFCTKCDIIYLNKTKCEEHKRTHEYKCKYICGYCPKEYNHKHLLTAHWKKFHKYTTEEFKCDECNKAFLTKGNYEKHLREVHPTKSLVFLCITCGLIGSSETELMTHSDADTSFCYESRISQQVLSTSYTCEFCYASFKHSSDLKLHRFSGMHMDNLYCCPLCGKKFEACKNMRSHLKMHRTYAAWAQNYPVARSYMCDVGQCEKIFTNWDVLCNHRRRVHQPRDCPMCQETLYDAQAFAQHTMKCSKKVALVCQFCMKTCPTKMSLSVHIARAHNNQNVTCPTCKMSYKNDTALKEHIDLEHVPTKCAECPKVIKNKRNLQLHVRKSHMKEKRFYCQDCPKSYYQKSELNTHIEHVHRKEKLHCDLCPFTTSYAEVLKRHRTDHANRSSFQCSFCSKEFDTLHLLNLHKQQHKTSKRSKKKRHVIATTDC